MVTWSDGINFAYIKRSGGLIAVAYQLDERPEGPVEKRNVRFMWAACAPEDAARYRSHEEKIKKRVTADLAYKRFMSAVGRDLNYYKFEFVVDNAEGAKGLYIQVTRQIEDRLTAAVTSAGDLSQTFGQQFSQYPALQHEDATYRDYIKAPGVYYWDPRYEALRPLDHKPRRLSASVVQHGGSLFPILPAWFI